MTRRAAIIRRSFGHRPHIRSPRRCGHHQWLQITSRNLLSPHRLHPPTNPTPAYTEHIPPRNPPPQHRETQQPNLHHTDHRPSALPQHHQTPTQTPEPKPRQPPPKPPKPGPTPPKEASSDTDTRTTTTLPTRPALHPLDRVIRPTRDAGCEHGACSGPVGSGGSGDSLEVLSTRVDGPVQAVSCVLVAVGAVLHRSTLRVVVRFRVLELIPSL